MKIALVNLTGGGLSGGSRKTMTRLLPQLLQEPDVEIKLFLHPRMENFGSDNGAECYMWPAMDHLCGYSRLKSEIRKYNPDIVFIPNSILPDFGDIPTVIMVRNMEPLTQPVGSNKLRLVIKNLLRRYIFKRSCRKATRVIAVSQFVKKYLIEKWNIAEEKIDVVYHGVDAEQHNLIRPQKLYALGNNKFILAAGSFYSYRGYEDVIKAFAVSNPDNTSLVLAGDVNGDDKYINKILRLIKDLGMESKIILPGFLSRNELSWCYANCSVFVMTSRVEACPNVVLEALSFGCINISTLSPPMPEMFASSAQYYNAGDVDRLTKILINCSNLDEATRNKYSANARGRAACFSWEKNADNLINIFRKVILSHI